MSVSATAEQMHADAYASSMTLQAGPVAIARSAPLMHCLRLSWCKLVHLPFLHRQTDRRTCPPSQRRAARRR